MRTGSMRIAEISLPAIRHNVRHLRELTGGNLIAVMKADAYGHGAPHVARAALEAGAMMLGVADIDEALALRAAGIDAPVLCWLHGLRSDFAAAVDHGIEVGVSRVEQLDRLTQAAKSLGKVAIVQLKIDTGLSRNGASPEHWQELFERAVALHQTGLVRVRGVFSHLANAGDDADAAQAARLDQAVELLRGLGCEPELVHLAASEAALTKPELHYNTVRVGMALYGLSSFANRSSAELGLIPAMTLKSEIVGLRVAAAGTGVSYEYTHRVERDTVLGLVSFGYADGLPRELSGSGTAVLVGGRRCPIVGLIAMDQCVVDLGDPDGPAAEVRIGDPVVLFGDPEQGVPPADLWAEIMGSINYEVIVGIGSRVARVAVDDASGDARGGSARFEVDSPAAMHELGVRLGRLLGAGDLVILTGPLGAGKTTLSRGIGEGLGVRGPVTSPTFVLARTHPSLVDGPPLVHVDAYRLADAGEVDDLDLDFESSVVVAEWGAGLIETRDSWIEIVIERPTGSTADDRSAADGRAGAATAVGFDGDAETDDELVEPRTLTITGHGPKWRGGVL